MDDYQIPTTDGRWITLRYDEVTRQTVIVIPPTENSDGAARSTVGLTPGDAEHFVDALTAIQARAAGGATG